MGHPDPGHGTNWRLLAGIAVVLLGYIGAAIAGWPQQGAETVARASYAEAGHGPGPAHAAEASGPGAATAHPPFWTILPFVLLLAAIAVLPLVTTHWWDNHLHRFYVAAGLGLLTLLYYLVLHPYPVQWHWLEARRVEPAAAGPNVAVTLTVLANSLLAEYVPFITLLFSLYTISGGIRIEGDLPAHPSTNAAFLAVGGILASFIGTTGAAMVLIRALLETNRERRHVQHTVVFFIFVVCNCGGCLTPLGDPPLFLGYLRGVDFLWTFRLWPEWLAVNGALIAIYYLWDRFWAYPKETPRDVARDEVRTHRLRFSGLWPNGVLLLGVILSIAFLDPGKPLPGTGWHPWVYLREVVQLAWVALSLLLGSKAPRRHNRFSYHAIVEVAVLFLGIFICMQPALEILHVRGPSLPLRGPIHFFWATGSLSSVLDNAPTYVVFFETARTLAGPLGGRLVAGVPEALLAGVSLGAVFMGAMTYIGNGPNFMVKAIAEKSGVRMPSFFGYMAYSVAVLLPLFALTSWLFLRGG
jgi:Na+/H+ antiporter NhaD/arsenite permease-like protein